MNGPSKSNDPDLWNGEKSPDSDKERIRAEIAKVREILRKVRHP